MADEAQWQAYPVRHDVLEDRPKERSRASAQRRRELPSAPRLLHELKDRKDRADCPQPANARWLIA